LLYSFVIDTHCPRVVIFLAGVEQQGVLYLGGGIVGVEMRAERPRIVGYEGRDGVDGREYVWLDVADVGERVGAQAHLPVEVGDALVNERHALTDGFGDYCRAFTDAVSLWQTACGR